MFQRMYIFMQKNRYHAYLKDWFIVNNGYVINNGHSLQSDNHFPVNKIIRGGRFK